MCRCYFGLYRKCIVLENAKENLKDIDELIEKFKNVEYWVRTFCSYCIKVHAEKRRKEGRFGVGVTI